MGLEKMGQAKVFLNCCTADPFSMPYGSLWLTSVNKSKLCRALARRPAVWTRHLVSRPRQDSHPKQPGRRDACQEEPLP